ncbi:hypothetical protein [Erythrobacter longus]|uniref:hypothetical protein n=1 Tax=Erythrobacter longus TaxID=1044 RepID=UPI0005550888|nr:hypothetical protein [Erythrobacter longus]
MAIEDHPDYPKWSDALDQLVAARDAMNEAKACGHTAELPRLQAELERAFAYYNKVSDEIVD